MFNELIKSARQILWRKLTPEFQSPGNWHRENLSVSAYPYYLLTRQAIGGQGLPHLKSVQLKCPAITTQILVEAKYGNSEENPEWGIN
jgi:hypothetical protein